MPFCLVVIGRQAVLRADNPRCFEPAWTKQDGHRTSRDPQYFGYGTVGRANLFLVQKRKNPFEGDAANGAARLRFVGPVTRRAEPRVESVDALHNQLSA